MVSVYLPKKTSRSGMVPAIAPYNKALLPAFFPKTASPTAAPNTICVSESNKIYLALKYHFIASILFIFKTLC